MQIVWDRFWPKVNKDAPNGCWEWTASRCKQGYGYFGVKLSTKKWKLKKTHRLSYEYANGAIPEGMSVLHKCDNPPCVNPAHLFLGTQTDNMRDAVSKGRKFGKQLFGEANYGSKLTEAQVKIIKYVGRSLPQQRLADLFGVTQTNIGCVLRGKTWSRVKIAE